MNRLFKYVNVSRTVTHHVRYRLILHSERVMPIAR